MTSISGKYALLTGGSRGIGPLIAEALTKRGANIVLCARSEKGLNDVAGTLKNYNVQVEIFPADLSQEGERKRLIDFVLSKFSRIDILINNAGIETEGMYMDLQWEDLKNTVEVNLITPMQLTYLVLPGMVKQKFGHIVNIASAGAKSGIPYAATYCGTKAGLVEWTRGMRLELEGTGVRFSSIMPGYVTGTGMFSRFNIVPPKIIGSCTPDQTVRAVIKAIEKGKKELIINSTPPRLLFALSELSPNLSDLMKKWLGIVKFQKRKILNKGDKPTNFIS